MPGKWLRSKTLALCLLFLLLAWLGISIPLHFRSVSPLLLERAGKDTPSVDELCANYTLAGKTGPVEILWRSEAAKPGNAERERIHGLLQAHPIYWLSGGPAPYLETYLNLLGEPIAPDEPNRIIGTLLPANRRTILAQYLSSSSNSAVQALLQARELSGWKSFLPVSSPAGQPLDATLLSLALLAQGENLNPELARQIPTLVDASLAQDRHAQDELEELLLGTLSLAKRMNWTQQTELFANLHNPADVANAARIFIQTPENFPSVYAATLLCGQMAPLENYLREHPDTGMAALRQTLPWGKGALEMLFEQGQDLYEAPAPVRWADKHLGALRPDFLLDYTLHNPKQALYLKLILIFASGYALALVFSRLLRLVGVLTRVRYRRKKSLLAVENFFIAAAFTILLWMCAEPNLLRFSNESHASHDIFETGAALAAAIIPQPNTMNANSLDQAAVLSLLLFFFLQLIVYVFCVMRIARVRAMKVPPATKMKLLENEDNLFDLGLYVGLSGTVTSLVMLAMNIVQASLVAAYASTLFGILFTATLKIVNIRPLRRRLILEAQGEPEPREPVSTQEG